ncbi:resolvase [Adhaeribacter aerolatus]|uniref:Resolvase n=1 Tax=Adhaeribacter aerolatus TaxID=670289 RepID=A0A512B0P8_9BACT|nr:recombinase family protein [Adhaeribacter aerolatus]GEO05538.1 resolvase [Adhaeribacter aerolatus]
MEYQKYIAYYRVSTLKQGRSGLGLEAQQAAVISFAKNPASIIREFKENESGKNDDRPLLEQAILEAKKHNATLIIAKLDRLSREVAFLFQLKKRVEKNNISWLCLDIPEMNTLNIGIWGTMAQHEREQISKRTKVALQALKARGQKLGNLNNLTAAGRELGVEAIKKKAATNDNNRRAAELVRLYREQGLTWLSIAEKLNQSGFRASKGGAFQATQVQRIFKRYCVESKNELVAPDYLNT